MAAMSGIEFEIVGHTTDAVASIRLLRQELSKLAKVHIGDLGLKSASTQISAFAKAVKQVDTDKMKALGSALKGLGQVGNSITTLERFAEAPQKALSGLEILEECLQELSQIDLSNLETAANGVKSIVYGMRELAGEPIETVVGEIDHFRTAIDKVGGAAKQFGSTMLRLASTPFKRFGESAKKVYGSVSNLGRSFLRIAMYRALRTVIKEITQAFSVGVKNLYGWSKAMNGVAMGSMFANTKLRTFAETMDNLSSASGYLKNSIGAAVAPFISSLAPAIDFAIGKIVALINVLNQLFALLGGASGWNKAIYKANEFEDAAGGAGGAAKEALRYLAPFDELNVLPDDNGGGGGGGGTDYSDMFEESEFMQSIKDFAQMVKDAWASGDWEEVGTFIGEKINEAIDNIPWSDIGANLGKGINAIIGTEYWTLETIDFTNLGDRIADAFNNMLENINFDIAGRLPVRKLTAIIDTIIGFIEGLDWHLVGDSIHDFFVGALSEMSEWFTSTDFTSFGSSLSSGIIEAIKGLKVSDITISLYNVLVSAIGAAAELLAGVVDGLMAEIFGGDLWNKISVKLGIDTETIEKTIDEWAENAKIEIPVDGKITDITDNVREDKKRIQGMTGGIEHYTDTGTGNKYLDGFTANVDKVDVPDKEKKFDLEGMIKIVDIISGNSNINIAGGSGGALSTGMILLDAAINFISGTFGFGKTDSQGNPIVDTTANYTKTDKTNLTDKARTISTWSDFKKTIKDNLSEKARTISTWSNFKARKDGLSDKEKTFATWSNFKARIDNLSNGEKTFGTTANFVSRALSLTNEEKTIDVKAKITSTSIGYTPTVSVVGKIAYMEKATGGIYSGGRWHNIPQYASGGRPANHGSLFIAGEAGAELVGHIGGRTEVLNQSQLAAVMSASVAKAIAGTHFTLSGMPVMSYGSSEQEVNEDAMYRAFKRALDETDFGEDIYLDGETVYRSVVKRNKQAMRATGINQLAIAM